MLIHNNPVPAGRAADGSPLPLPSRNPEKKSSLLRSCGIVGVSLLLAYANFMFLLTAMYHRHAGTLI